MQGQASLVVGTNDTAPRIGSGRVAVLGTPVMITLMEEAALACVEHALDPGHQSLGTHLDVSHVAATPIGIGSETWAGANAAATSFGFMYVESDHVCSVFDVSHDSIAGGAT